MWAVGIENGKWGTQEAKAFELRRFDTVIFYFLFKKRF